MQHQQVNQQPDFDPSGIALAPFPDENSGSNNYNSRKNFNYDNLHRRQPSNTPQNTQLNSRFSDNAAPYRNFNNDNLFNNNGPIYNPEGAAKVPLAGIGGGVQVPLAPL